MSRSLKPVICLTVSPDTVHTEIKCRMLDLKLNSLGERKHFHLKKKKNCSEHYVPFYAAGYLLYTWMAGSADLLEFVVYGKGLMVPVICIKSMGYHHWSHFVKTWLILGLPTQAHTGGSNSQGERALERGWWRSHINKCMSLMFHKTLNFWTYHSIFYTIFDTYCFQKFCITCMFSWL